MSPASIDAGFGDEFNGLARSRPSAGAGPRPPPGALPSTHRTWPTRHSSSSLPKKKILEIAMN